MGDLLKTDGLSIFHIFTFFIIFLALWHYFFKNVAFFKKNSPHENGLKPGFFDSVWRFYFFIKKFATHTKP